LEADHSYKLGLQCGIRRTPMLFILIPDLPRFTGGRGGEGDVRKVAELGFCVRTGVRDTFESYPVCLHFGVEVLQLFNRGTKAA